MCSKEKRPSAERISARVAENERDGFPTAGLVVDSQAIFSVGGKKGVRPEPAPKH